MPCGDTVKQGYAHETQGIVRSGETSPDAMKNGHHEAFDCVGDPSSGKVNADFTEALPVFDHAMPMLLRSVDTAHEFLVGLEGMFGDEKSDLWRE